MFDRLILFFTAFAAGSGVAAGTFAFLLVIRVLPRMIQKGKLSASVRAVENAVIAGVLFGLFFSLWPIGGGNQDLPGGWLGRWNVGLVDWLGGFGERFFLGGLHFLLGAYGLCSGIFAGCIAVALAEILETFPIFFRRLRMKQNLVSRLIFAMAAGKVAGSLFYFLTGYGTLEK